MCAPAIEKTGWHRRGAKCHSDSARCSLSRADVTAPISRPLEGVTAFLLGPGDRGRLRHAVAVPWRFRGHGGSGDTLAVPGTPYLIPHPAVPSSSGFIPIRGLGNRECMRAKSA
jgi:hypothetical protein